MDRRAFIQAASIGVSSLAYGAKKANALVGQDRSHEYGQALQEFDYSHVELQPGLHQAQLENAHAVLMELSEDSLLRPFRRRAGLPAPGAALGGWYSSDERSALTFGQCVSALARYCAITGDEATRAKVDRLVVPTPKPSSHRGAFSSNPLRGPPIFTTSSSAASWTRINSPSIPSLLRC